jgi:Tfp pilus assembly protein PilF
MKKVFIFILLSGMTTLSWSQTVKESKMPVTTASGTALEFYNEAMNWFDKVDLNRGSDQLTKALDEDRDFFMANYQMALYYSWTGNFEKFSEYAEKAVNCKATLSKAEELLKSAIDKLRANPQADITETGKKLVEMYPRDINAYNNLIYFQSFNNDIDGQLVTLNQALRINPDQPSLYNQLGYVYMQLKQNEKAEAAFDKYIELDPKNPNVYDSKGDFYINIKEYRKAYESYMKAHLIDTAWGYEKAQKAKQLYEMAEGKKLEIILL